MSHLRNGSTKANKNNDIIKTMPEIAYHKINENWGIIVNEDKVKFIYYFHITCPNFHNQGLMPASKCISCKKSIPKQIQIMALLLK